MTLNTSDNEQLSPKEELLALLQYSEELYERMGTETGILCDHNEAVEASLSANTPEEKKAVQARLDLTKEQVNQSILEGTQAEQPN